MNSFIISSLVTFLLLCSSHAVYPSTGASNSTEKIAHVEIEKTVSAGSKNKCLSIPQPCSQFCNSTTDDDVTCSCATGYDLAPDNSTCSQTSGVDPYLIISNQHGLLSFTTGGAKTSYVIIKDGIETFGYHLKSNKLFYFNTEEKALEMSSLVNASDSQHLLSMENLQTLTVEWVTDKLYWTVPKQGIYVSDLNGTHVNSIVTGCFDQKYCLYLVTSLIAHPRLGYIFWGTKGYYSHIGRAGLNGDQPKVIVAQNDSSVNSMTIDYETDTLYWTDLISKSIKQCDLDGKNIRQLEFQNVKIFFPLSISTFESHVYWYDEIKESIYKANVTSQTYSMKIELLHYFVKDMKIVHPYKQNQSLSNPCSINNGGCPHLCLLKPGDSYECHCDANFIEVRTRSGLKCEADCSSSQFLCHSGNKCIDIDPYVCDGRKDCPDGSDEPDTCEPRRCANSQFQCDNSYCLSKEVVCDGKNDCADNSDEESCSDFICPESKFKCKTSGLCIYDDRVCDKIKDCDDGSDEDHCNRNCSSREFQCENGECVWKDLICDNKPDCVDKSDEASSLCANTTAVCELEKSVYCEPEDQCLALFQICDFKEDCSDGSDEKNCDSFCPSYMAECKVNSTCIYKFQVCDGAADCNDHSDEENCLASNCTDKEFACKDNRFCIPKAKICNQHDDCFDGSDEVDCESNICDKGFYQCKTGHCIPEHQKCDGNIDCVETMDDELNCPPRYANGTYCLSTMFECSNHICIKKELICDSIDDCGDSSDETPEVCESKPCDPGVGFRCLQSRTCLPKSFLCDNLKDCSDGSDESASICHSECKLAEFRCNNGNCISSNKACDHYDDCGDLSDESLCHHTGITCADNPCHHICEEHPADGNTTTYFTCSCHEGFQPDPIQKNQCVDIDECKAARPACSQKCENQIGSYKCSCDEGYTLSSHNTCYSTDAAYAMFSENGKLVLLDLNMFRVIPYINTEYEVNKLEYMFVDSNTSVVYWTSNDNDRESTIYRSVVYVPEVNSTNYGLPQKLETSYWGFITSISVDFITGNLYFASYHSNSIMVTTKDGRYTKTVLNNFKMIRSIAVNPNLGVLYFSIFNEQFLMPGSEEPVYKMNMDGSNVKPLHLENHKLVELVTDIVVDFHNYGRLYMTVDYPKAIISCDSNGKNVYIFHRQSSHQKPSSYSALAEFDDHILWLNKNDIKIYSQNKVTSDQLLPFNLSGIKYPHDFVIANKHRSTPKSNPCKDEICSHLCLLTANNTFKCACPDGTRFIENSKYICDVDKIPEVPLLDVCQCVNGGTCSYIDGTKPHCSCPTNYRGKNCEEFWEESAASKKNVALGLGLGLPFGFLVAIAIALLIYKKKKGQPIRELSQKSCLSFKNDDGRSPKQFENPILFNPPFGESVQQANSTRTSSDNSLQDKIESFSSNMDKKEVENG